MKLASTLIFVFVAWLHCSDGSTDMMWKQWKREHGKVYDGVDDESSRRHTWENNLAYIKEHNHKHDQGQISYKMGLNEFSDMTWPEFQQIYLPSNFTANSVNEPTNPTEPIVSELEIKRTYSFDWRNTTHVVLPVQNQGPCGSCWAFSAVGAIEGQYGIKFKKSQRFSEQQLVDCTKGNSGCHGGWMNTAFRYVKRYGIESEEDYPYEARDTTCRYNRNAQIVKVASIMNIMKGYERKLARVLRYRGPLSVTLHVERDFLYYKSGIFISNTCKSIPSHAILLVGYGSERGQKYWTIKNSWGTHWGENGYMRLARDRNNMCGIAQYASIPRLSGRN